MAGLFSGYVRSTPTPKLILRTVKVSRSPAPCRRITTPWKACTRERFPSTTRACTLTVSPARKSGRSVRCDWASRASSVFIAASSSYSKRIGRSEEHTSELQSRQYLVCRLLLEKKKQILKAKG